MGKRGPAPIPTELKLLRGNPGKQKIDPNEVKPPSDNVLCPDWIKGKAREQWDRLAPALSTAGMLTNLDVDMFAMLCQAIADFAQYNDAIKEGKLPIYKQGDQIIPHPLISMRRRTLADVLKLGARFGMTPSDRVGLNVKLLEDEDELKGFIKGRAGG